jgi:putative restriction endonuclease
MYLALIEPGSYMDLADPVAFTDANGVIERGVLNDEGRISGRAQSAVRPLSPSDFNRIVSLGLGEEAPALPRIDAAAPNMGVQDERAVFVFEQPRDRVAQLSSRIIRDLAFRSVILRAYAERCAITGLRLINGGGARGSRGGTYSSGGGERTGYRQQRDRLVGNRALDVRSRLDRVG